MLIGADGVGWRKNVVRKTDGKDLSEDAILMSESVANWITTQSLCGES